MQRSVEDQSILVATYDGEHDHQPEATFGSNRCLSISSAPYSTSLGSSRPNNNITLDFTKPKTSNIKAETSTKPRMDSPDVQQFLVDQMVSSLTKDPNFTATLAAAISGIVYQHST